MSFKTTHINFADINIVRLKTVLESPEGSDLLKTWKNEKGNTLLMWAAEEGHFEVVDLLIKAGFSPATKNNDGQTAKDLALAACSDHQKVIKLIEADENYWMQERQNFDGQSLIFMASCNEVDVIKKILAASRPSLDDRHLKVALEKAVERNHSETVSTLVKYIRNVQ